MRKTSQQAFPILLTGVLRRLHPGQAERHPGLFILEVAAALLSVLALRDTIAGGPAVSLELTAAVGLWATLLTVACGLSLRMSFASMLSGRRAPDASLR
jgi:high-affinity K+ transport system ATPase subunit B